ncbi:MAG: type II toxin-antitoxin system RelE/ParE family toxin [Pseudomonadales bacterium]
MNTFALTHKAKADLRAIALFTEKTWGREQRNLYLKQLDDAFHMLAQNTQAGKTCDDIKIGYKKFPQGSHIIFYKAGNQTSIEIIRILHKHMDVDTQLSP